VLRRAQAARLLAVDREASGTRLLLLGRDEKVVGSAAGLGLQIADPSVADRHAIIRYARGRYYVRDLKSTGGTFLNGRRIRWTQLLKHGDNLRFGGGIPYRFIDPDALKRRRERRFLRAASVIAALIAIAWLDHRERWNLLSLTTVNKIAAWAYPQTIAKRGDSPLVVAAIASKIAASIAPAANAPSRAASTPAAIYVAAIPTPIATPISSGPSSSWLERINFYRAGDGLAGIRGDSDLSATVASHAQYLLLNFGDDIRASKPMSPAAYDETPGKSGYSADGALVARNVQLAWGCAPYDAAAQIDRWVAGPFHRLALLDPFLTEAAFGEAASDGCWAAALRFPPAEEEVKPYARAVEFPPDGALVSLEWTGIEAPDPLASCPGYQRPAGLPITLQLGRRVETKLSAHWLMENGKPIEHCAFDAQSYQNQDPSGQEYGRANLRNRGGVVIVPRAPLKSGARYSVSIAANDQNYTWSFTVADATKFAPVASFPESASPAPPAAAVPLSEPSEAVSSRLRKIVRTSRRASVASAEPRMEAASSSTAREESSGTSGGSSNWIDVLNAYRARLGVPPVTEDPILSRGDLAHAKYLVTNYHENFKNLGGLLHEEDESKPGYSPEGRKAGRASDVKFQTRMTASQAERAAIEWWIAGPFHRPTLINPDLTRVGFGQYCEGIVCVAVLDCVSDLQPAPASGRALARPIEVPPDGATVKSVGFKNEWPDPVSSCPGYTARSAAITLQLGMHVRAKLTDASITQTTGAAAGMQLQTCAYDSEGYTNPDASAQTRGRQILDSFGEVIMIVRDPLAGGQTYRVAMTVNGKPYSWTFSTLP
jgi:uncharacterized protein YkwD